MTMVARRFTRVPALDGQTPDRLADATPASFRSLMPSALTAAAVFLVIELWQVARRVPLGHDEAVYLLRSRFMAGSTAIGGHEGYWAAYRAPGLPALLSVPMRFVGESVTVSRAIVVLLGAGCVVATSWWVGRLAGRTAGMIAPWIVVMTGAFTSYASLLLLDVPGTFLVVVAALIVERSTARGEVDWWPLLLLPPVALAAVYVRFGAPTNLAAVIAAVLAARADLLLRAGRRTASLVRLGAAGLLTAVAVGSVLVIPAMTQSRTSPLRLQRIRQEQKEVSSFASYGDTFDLLWPDGSRTGETFTWLALAVVVVGSALTLVSAALGYRRRAAIAGIVGTSVWLVGLNYALAEMFGNYLGLGVPFFALLASPGWAWLHDRMSPHRDRRRVAVALASVVAVIGCTQAMVDAGEQVSNQEGFEFLRSTGAQINAIAPDQECAVVTSYVQVTWYADCVMTNFGVMQPGTYGAFEPQQRGVFDLDEIRADHIYVVLVERGKRQPEGEKLDTILSDSRPVIEVAHDRYPVEVRVIVDVD